MKLSAFTTAALLTATLAVRPSLSQTPVKTDLNLQMKQALCVQNWVQAIRIVDRMKAAAPQQAAELNLFRGQIQTILRTGASVTDWPSASECAAAQVVAPTYTPGNSNIPASVRNVPQHK